MSSDMITSVGGGHSVANSLTALATHLELPVVFFRAGAARFHDTLDSYRQIQSHLTGSVESRLFVDLDIWAIVALIQATPRLSTWRTVLYHRVACTMYNVACCTPIVQCSLYSVLYNVACTVYCTM